MYIYEMNPIDIWSGWIRLEDAIAEPGKYDIAGSSTSTDEKEIIDELREKLDYVKYLLARHTPWEGDGRVYLTSMPTEVDGFLVFAIKQDNNGTTYLASPIEYPHLKEYLVHTTSNKKDIYS
ncbi:MAG: hypothetical protein EOO61_05505 [Hymenobacter sp.]|nr:MAG: hypothetical protein EOO61_05505 [Hymenobacter sp.]